MAYERVISRTGRITIPIELRRRLGLKLNDRVSFDLDGDRIILRPVASSILRHYGSVKPLNRPEDWAEVRSEVERLIAEDVVAEDR